ncbi:hypothetical protein CBS101457_002121 [Exobasidium rhododendri]|nr:hypothetical protein CBS101457_002121 [Exobasidium rhododendri]
MDDDDWQEMPVVRDTFASSSSDEEGSSGSKKGRFGRKGKDSLNRYNISQSYKRAELNKSPPSRTKQGNAATNATGTHLDIDDARGYDWRTKPKGLGDSGGYDTAAGDAKKGREKKQVKRKGKASESSGSSSEEDKDDEGGARGYTQLRLDDDVEGEELSAATDYLFTGGNSQAALEEGDIPTATPHSQLNTTKNLLSEGQKIAYVGLVSLVAKNIIQQLKRVPGKELQAAISSTEEWRLRVMARLFQHMDIESGEQNMIESLSHHGVLPGDLSPSLITTQTVDNPDFDPESERVRAEEQERGREQEEMKVKEKESQEREEAQRDIMVSSSQRADDDPNDDTQGRLEDDGSEDDGDLGSVSVKPVPSSDTYSKNEKARSPPIGKAPGGDDDDDGDIAAALESPTTPTVEQDRPIILDPNTATQIEVSGNTNVTPMGLTNETQAIDTLPNALEGVTTELSSADKTITLDLRWTVLCDLFLVLTADSVYDSRSRVLLEWVAFELGLQWMDVTKFEKRVTDALEIEEGVGGSLKGKRAVRKQAQAARRRRMVMMGLATVGGGLVIGLSAGLMAPLIGAGLGAALGTIGIGGTTSFLGGIGGAAIITTTGTVGGAALGGTGMNHRTRTVRTFEFKPIHNNKRVNAIVTVGGFMNGPSDDPRLPFSVIDSIMGDVFSVLWEPDMMQEMGNAINLLWNETLVQGVQQVLAATIAGGLVGALAWPLWLTKLGWFIDNPWSNALDRAHSCGLILADVLSKRKLGVRPITLVGFSLGARVIFYALAELAKQKKFGIVQNVYLVGAPVTASDKTWKEARGVVAGRFVNAFSRTDWILGYLFRATTGGLRSIAGLHPVERVPEVENIDVTKTVPGHLQYRAFMPLVLDELGFRTTADYFDEPEDLDMIPEREVRYDEALQRERESKNGPRPKGFASLWKKKQAQGVTVTTPMQPEVEKATNGFVEYDDDDLPPRQDENLPAYQEEEKSTPRMDLASSRLASPTTPSARETDEMAKILAELRENGIEVKELESSLPTLPITHKPAIKGGDHVDFRGSSSSILEVPTQAYPKDSISISRRPSTGPSSSTSSHMGSDVRGTESEGESVGSQQRKVIAAYPRKYSSAIFDADELPPAASQASDDHDEVSLSFAENYEEEVDAQDSSGYLAAPTQATDTSAQPLKSAKQYGLSDETARELARQFQSSGMSTQGASAAAKLAQNFSESSSSMTNQSASFDSDPWDPTQRTTLAPPLPPQTLSMGKLKSEDEEILKSASLRPPVSGTWNENPWD